MDFKRLFKKELSEVFSASAMYLPLFFLLPVCQWIK